MSDVIYRDICIRQGAEYRAEYQRIESRYLHEARNAGTSDASAPAFTSVLDSTVLDNDITWLNKGLWDEDEQPDVDVWLASTAYARRAKVVSPIVAVDLTGYTGDFQIRATIDAVAALYTGTVQFGTRSEGKFNMIIPTADTAAMTFDNAVYDLELSTAASEVDFVVRGAVVLLKEVTR